MRTTKAAACVLLFGVALLRAAYAQSSDDAALDLKPAEAEPVVRTEAPKSLRIMGEAAAGRLSQRHGLPTEDARRASLDVYWEFRPAARWKGVLSNRLDDMHPVDPGSRSTLNSLREAYLGWMSEDGRWGLDVGRLNVRNGPAYGFNPTDYFRDGASRAVTSADPLSLRENRLGTAMLRVQSLWDGGSATLALAPKLANGPSADSFDVDLGATNHAHRLLSTVSLQLNKASSAQLLAYFERGKGLQLGVNATTLLGPSIVGFAEWSGGRDTVHDGLLSGSAARVDTRHRAAAGLTYTTDSRWALTAEFQYNGFALGQGQWAALQGAGPEASLGYQYLIQQRQDIASRRALMAYVSQRDGLLKNLELTGLLRYNLDDNSRFAWAEARYHWPRFDVALQWQATLGRSTSEYGSQPGSRLLQVLVAAYF